MSIEVVYKKLSEQPIELDEVQKRRVLSHVLNWRSWPRKSRAPWIVAAAAVVAAALAVVLLLALVRPGHATLEDRPTATGGGQLTTLALAGLGRAILQPGADVSIETKTDRLLEVAQARGSVHYEIDRPAGHQVVVRAGGYELEVVGTVFEVAVDDANLSVRVDDGIVQIEDDERIVKLVAGDEISMAVRDATDLADRAGIAAISSAEQQGVARQYPAGSATSGNGSLLDVPEPVKTEKQQARPEPVAPATPESNGTDLASEPNVVPPPSIEEMLSSVDEARREGTLAEASRLLDQVAQRYPSDPRSINALFTMGNVERQRGNHAKAARAYDRCWRLNPSGLLAEDARAESAVSWVKAGRKDLAAKAAMRYLELYPQGNHVARMKSLIE